MNAKQRRAKESSNNKQESESRNLDHLLSSSGGEHILVPYVGVEEYDRGAFKPTGSEKVGGQRREET
jgi:hypothetical protein